MATRKLIRDAVTVEFLGEAPARDRFDRLVALFVEILGGGVEYDVVEDSLRGLAGTRLDARLIDETAWRLAGNLPRLRQRRAVPRWHVQKVPEWVPVQVVTCRRDKNGAGTVGVSVGFRVLAGTPCPAVMFRWLSVKQCRYYAPGFGWSKSGGASVNHVQRYPYAAPEQLVGLRCLALVTPAACGAEPGFEQIEFSPGLRAWNREVIKSRLRAGGGYVCPEGNPRDFPCHKCPRGYTKCRAGTHRLDWVQKPCPGCNTPDAWFDPEYNDTVCIDCRTTALYTKGK